MDSPTPWVNFDPNETLRGLVRFFQFVGIWPLNCKYRFLYAIYGVLFQFTFSYAYTGCETGNIFYAPDMHVLTEQIFVGLAEISMCIRMTNFVVNFKEASNFLNVIKSFELRNQEEYELYKKRLSLLSNVMTFYLSCASFAIAFSIIAPLFDEKRRLPYPGWYPLDWENDMTSYWIMYGYQVMGVIFLAHTLVRLEIYHIYCIICAATQMEILSMRMSTIGHSKLIKIKDLSNQEIRQKEERHNIASLLESIKTHTFLMRFVADIERIFSKPFLFQLFCSSVIFCLTGFQIIMNMLFLACILYIFDAKSGDSSDDTISLAYYVCFSATMLNEIFLPCYFGTLLTSKSKGLSGGIYSSNWPDQPESFKKIMIVFLENLKREKIMKSGKIFTLTLSSFLTVINRSYSMFAVLRTLIK